jgi:hypothetical protein
LVAAQTFDEYASCADTVQASYPATIRRQPLPD